MFRKDVSVWVMLRRGMLPQGILPQRQVSHNQRSFEAGLEWMSVMKWLGLAFFKNLIHVFGGIIREIDCFLGICNKLLREHSVEQDM